MWHTTCSLVSKVCLSRRKPSLWSPSTYGFRRSSPSSNRQVSTWSKLCSRCKTIKSEGKIDRPSVGCLLLRPITFLPTLTICTWGNSTKTRKWCAITKPRPCTLNKTKSTASSSSEWWMRKTSTLSSSKPSQMSRCKQQRKVFITSNNNRQQGAAYRDLIQCRQLARLKLLRVPRLPRKISNLKPATIWEMASSTRWHLRDSKHRTISLKDRHNQSYPQPSMCQGSTDMAWDSPICRKLWQEQM